MVSRFRFPKRYVLYTSFYQSVLPTFKSYVSLFQSDKPLTKYTTSKHPFRRFSTHVWQNARVNTVRRAMCFLLFLKLYNFIKGIMRICVVFLKNLRLMFLDFTYYLVLIFITCNRTDVSLFKKVSKYEKRNVLIFLYTMCKGGRKLELFFHSYLAVFP